MYLPQVCSYLPKLQVVPLGRDKSEDLIQLKVLLLAADRQVVEDQVHQVHPPEGQTPHVLRALITHCTHEQVEPAGGTGSQRQNGEGQQGEGQSLTCLQTSLHPAGTACTPRGTTADT